MKSLVALPLLVLSAAAWAAPTVYNIEPDHTYPSFEADHMGLSTWRGKFDKTSGTITLDKVADTGTVDVTVDVASVDFGHQKMNEHAVKSDILDAARYPTARYQGKLVDFKDGRPTRVEGQFTLHGVTAPLNLEINSFKCMQHPFYKKEACGADAFGIFQRDDYGIDAGKAYGFDMRVTLRIQVEALAAAPAAGRP